MRTRAILGILGSVLLVDLAAGCQIIAQLNVLQVGGGTTTTTGTGGTGGASSTSSSTSTSSGASSTSSSTSSSSGSSGFVCGSDAGSCSASSGGTMGCPTCSGNVCQAPCNSSMNCTTNGTVIPTTMGGTAIQCTDTTCKGVTFTCTGTNLCEVDCKNSGSCQGLTLKCGDGPCRLRCDKMACSGTTIECGQNSCDTEYYAPPDGGPLPDAGPPPDGGTPGLPVTQTGCDASCDCTNTNLSP
jgi:hypothetical protein